MKQKIQWTQDEESYLVLCNCGTPEHQLILTYFPGDDDKTCFIQVHLTYWEGFFRRLWAGLRYAFGYRSRYGEFDEICLNKWGARALAEFLLEFADQKETTWTTTTNAPDNSYTILSSNP